MNPLIHGIELLDGIIHRLLGIELLLLGTEVLVLGIKHASSPLPLKVHVLLGHGHGSNGVVLWVGSIEQCTQAHFISLMHAVGACYGTEAIDAEGTDGRDVVRRPREGVGHVHGHMLDDLEIERIWIGLCKYPKWNWFVCTKNG